MKQRVDKNHIAQGLYFNDIPCFDSISYKEDFIDWILDFEDYFAYAMISEDFKVLLVLYRGSL